jgi:hypothetical protein
MEAHIDCDNGKNGTRPLFPFLFIYFRQSEA